METILALVLLIVIVWVIKIFLTNGGEKLIEKSASTATTVASSWNDKASINAFKTRRDALRELKNVDLEEYEQLNQLFSKIQKLQDEE